MSARTSSARAREDARAGKAPSTQAGEFIREEFHHIREGVHGARSTRQAIAIGMSKARRAGVKLPPPGKSSPQVRRQAECDYAKGQNGDHHRPSAKRSHATLRALRHEGRQAASSTAISRQVHASAQQRTAQERSGAAQKAVRIKGPSSLAASARKAARIRQTHSR